MAKRLKHLMIVSVFLCVCALSPWASSTAPNLNLINKLIAGPQLEGVNCAGAALLGAGLLKVPLFVSPLVMDKMRNTSFRMVRKAEPGDIGAVIGEEGSQHFFTYLQEGVFNRFESSGAFAILPEEEALAPFDGTKEVWRYRRRKDCALRLLSERLLSPDEDGRLLSRAVSVLRSRNGLDKAQPLSGEEISALEYLFFRNGMQTEPLGWLLGRVMWEGAQTDTGFYRALNMATKVHAREQISRSLTRLQTRSSAANVGAAVHILSAILRKIDRSAFLLSSQIPDLALYVPAVVRDTTEATRALSVLEDAVLGKVRVFGKTHIALHFPEGRVTFWLEER